MTLRAAFAAAGVVTMDGMLVRSFETTGVIDVINIGCSNEEGFEWSIDLLATQEIELDEHGCASVPDLDGEDTRLTFYVPMKG
jgi:hypothetical protein